MPLFKVDLSQAVSRYVGETVKNIRSVVAPGESAGAVVLFDEANALFGRRTEVRDAHDRYANVEITCLPQRMEKHAGLAVLTTNFKEKLDGALTRGLATCLGIEHPASLLKRME